MHKKKERITVLSSLIILHLGVILKFSGISPVGLYVLVTGVVLLSLVYGAKGIYILRKSEHSSNAVFPALLFHHLNLFIAIYTILFLFLKNREVFFIFASISLAIAIPVYIFHFVPQKKLFSNPEFIKSAAFNGVILTGVVLYIFAQPA